MYDAKKTHQSSTRPHIHAGFSNSSNAKNNAPQAQEKRPAPLKNLTNERESRFFTNTMGDISLTFENALTDYKFYHGSDPDQWEQRTILTNIIRKDLFSLLRQHFPDIRDWKTLGKNNYFHWNSVMKRSIIERCDLHNVPLEEIPAGQSTRAAYREPNLMRCFVKKEDAQMVTYEDGERHVEGFSCKIRYCTCCADGEARRSVKNMYLFLEGLIEATEATSFYRFVFTLPEEIEADIPKGSDLRTTYRNAVRRYVYKFFGLDERKDKLAIYFSFHPVGNKSLDRDRYHLHVGVLTSVSLRKMEDGTQKPVRLDIPNFLPKEQFDSLRPGYVKLLNRVFERKKKGLPLFTDAVVDLSRVDLTVSPDEWKAKLRHRMNYDARGFGKDFREGVLYWSPSTNMVVVRNGETNNFGYVVMHLDEYVDRWKHVRDERDFRGLGLLHGREKNGDAAAGIVEIVEDLPPISSVDPVDVEREYGRIMEHYKVPGRFKRAVRFKKIMETRVYLNMPDGTRVELDPKSVKLGMRGKKRYWAPKGTQTQKTDEKAA